MNEQDHATVEAMEARGGSFVKALANLVRHADADNLRRIKETWPTYWATYTAKASSAGPELYGAAVRLPDGAIGEVIRERPGDAEVGVQVHGEAAIRRVSRASCEVVSPATLLLSAMAKDR